MAIDFSKVTAWTIPEGNVSQVSVNNVVIWQAAIEAIVSGTDTLTLPDAVQSAVVYLKQSGIVSQNGTPTPSSPVDIKCNNGTLTFKDEELPYGYSRIESITFSGSTYYDTDEKLYGSDIVTMTIALSSTGGQNLFGCYSGTDDVNFSLYVYGTAAGQAYWRYGTTLYRPTLGGTAQRTISFGAGGTTGFSQNVSYSEVEFETTSAARIGALPNSSSPKFSGTIYGNITVASRLKYIPCIRSSDSKIGYYETVKGVFLEPQGSAPTAGAYDYNHLAPYVVGTPEVITLGTQIASAENLFAVGEYFDEQDIVAGNVTRKVGIKIFDGTESYSSMSYGYATDGLSDFPNENFMPLCTHFVGKTTASAAPDTLRLYFTSGGVPRTYFFVDQTVDDFSTVEKFQAWLTAQCAAGTPVIVVYPLAEPVTESVTPQPLNLAKGDNIVSTSAEVTSIPLAAKYKKKR